MKSVPGEELLHALGRLAQQEAERTDADESDAQTEQVQQLLRTVLAQRQHATSDRAWRTRLMFALRSWWFGTALLVSVAAALLVWVALPKSELPEYSLAVLSNVAETRGAHEQPTQRRAARTPVSAAPPAGGSWKALVPGSTVQLLLRPTTSSSELPVVSVSYDDGRSVRALPAAVQQLANSGAMRLSVSLPDHPGRLEIRMGAAQTVPWSVLRSFVGDRAQTWQLEVRAPQD